MKETVLTPWQAYQAIYARYSVSIFLDSIEYHKPNQRHSLIGCDAKAELVLSEKDLKTSKKSIQKIRNFISSGQDTVFGYFSYEAAALFDKIYFRKKKPTGYPAVYLAKFRNLYRFDHKLGRWIGRQPGGRRAEPRGRKEFKVEKFKPEISKKYFLEKVRRAKRYIEAGDIYQTNLSQKYLFDYQGLPLDIYGHLRKINPSPFSSFLKVRDLEVASSSPERLIQKRGSICETRPIAGTCSRTTNPACRTGRHGSRTTKELVLWKKNLLGSKKERAEHLMLVDLERNDLGRVCEYKTVNVREFMTLEEYSHVVHLVSSVAGKLRKDKDALDLFAAMFPGGTITGCPKIHCMEIIDKLEPSRRGLYTGSIGYFSPARKSVSSRAAKETDMDWNIVIRTLIFNRGKGSFQVGAGIVYDSDPEREYQETLAKGEALMQALAEARP